MNENVTIDMEKTQENGQITYANEVIATIVSVATTEVEGISGITGTSSLSGLLAKGKTPRGVKVEMDGGSVKVDVSVNVDYGMPIQKVGRNAQENIRKSIESMTGLHVERVDLHVVGVSFEKENQEMQQSQKLAAISFEEEHPAIEEPANEPEPAEEEAPAEEAESVIEEEIEVEYVDDEEETASDDEEEEAEDAEEQAVEEEADQEEEIGRAHV